MHRLHHTLRNPLLQRSYTALSIANKQRTPIIYLRRVSQEVSPAVNVRALRRRHTSTSITNNHQNISAFSTAAASPSTTTSDTSDKSQDTKSNNKKKDDSNIFLDNLGKIFLSTIALVLLSLLRSNKGNNAKAALRDDIETAALLDPLEIEDLRLANDFFTREVWDEIIKEFVGRGADARIGYGEFMNVVLNVLRGRFGEGATVQFGHLMDRVVVAELERMAEQEGGDDMLPISFLLTALSLALNSSVTDRVEALYNVMVLMQGDTPASSAGQQQQTVSLKQVEQMVQHLQNTCQLVPDAQIVPTVSNIPYQMYRVGDGAELTQRACEGLALIDGEKKSDGQSEKVVALDDFYVILKSRSVCAWGECYVKKTARMATSDR